jgi:hypothetical protein
VNVRSCEGHALQCLCPLCSEAARLHEQHLTHDAPLSSLPASSVSLQELSDVRTTPHYTIGEDWSDD